MKLTIITCGEYPGLSSSDRYYGEALSKLGFEIDVVPWDRKPDTHRAAAVILRSPWDYHSRLPEFQQWIADVEEAGVCLLNPPSLIRWNMHKRYLLDLKRANVRIPRTELWENVGDFQSFKEAATAVIPLPEGKGILKPAWGGDGVGVTMFSLSKLDEAFSRVQRTLPDRPLIFQTYVPEITEHGETSFIFIGGRFAHAVCTRPAPGDFRINNPYDPLPPERLVPTERMLSDAELVMSSLPTQIPPLYARIDGIMNRDGNLIFLEAEVIDPALFMHLAPETAELFARATQEYIQIFKADPGRFATSQP